MELAEELRATPAMWLLGTAAVKMVSAALLSSTAGLDATIRVMQYLNSDAVDVNKVKYHKRARRHQGIYRRLMWWFRPHHLQRLYIRQLLQFCWLLRKF
ncbi:hypothetical protein ColLi_13552 [Colletotrichum liriopes]|uniref:Uncharacterized protein n=1 Tax=Colletotrichum liriopes TaxID=708192 RepID=A0AA37LZU0_9PEZI|nr:hypothetical protein ColLi_13552 [Colletotrichum liriopes]